MRRDRVELDRPVTQLGPPQETHAAGAIVEPAEVSEPAKGGHAGWGLFSIRERLTLLGGRFDIESSPGEGARFRLIAPLGAPDITVAQDPQSHGPLGPVSPSARTEQGCMRQ